MEQISEEKYLEALEIIHRYKSQTDDEKCSKMIRVKILEEAKNDKASDFWYVNSKDEYIVKLCSSRRQLFDVAGVSQYEPKELYIVATGTEKGNIILRKHCQIL